MPRLRSSNAVETLLAASTLDPRGIPLFRRTLLRWYERNRRALPWRKTCDSYRIWISEIMLQQTRVSAVLEHYRLFLRRFPDVRALAQAPESAVLAAWSGLGYYRRARMMRLCAQTIVKEHRGRFPKTAAQLRALPGIGRYTAAAIASIAFAEPVAVVDGNVERVTERLTGEKLSAKEHWQRAQDLLTPARPGDHNQAMMELGATVCTPRQPKCGVCPVRKWCTTQGESRREANSARPSKKEIWRELAHRDGHIRLVQRDAQAALMAGMWELPQCRAAHGVERQAPSPGRERKGPQPWRTFCHSITTTDYRVHVVRRNGKGPGRWVAVDQLSEMPITGLTRKILKAARII